MKTPKHFSLFALIMMLLGYELVMCQNELSGKYFIVSELGTCLDIKQGNSDPGTPIQMWSCNECKSQKWELIPSENGYTFIKSELGSNLDVQWANPNPGTPVHTWSYNGGKARKWN